MVIALNTTNRGKKHSKNNTRTAQNQPTQTQISKETEKKEPKEVVVKAGRGWKLVKFPNGKQNIYSTIYGEYLLDEPITHIWAIGSGSDVIYQCYDKENGKAYKLDLYGRTVI